VAITPAIALRKTEYADIYEEKRLLLDTRFQGHMTSPTMADIYPPRLILMKRGNSAVRSHPALTELAEMFVPI
jgi:hypothetical protein